jgi:hypothetical protein
MDVIRRHYPREKIIGTANAFSVKQGFHEDGSNPRLAEPARARGRSRRRLAAG